MIVRKQIFGGLGIYFALRLFSYFFSPGTPLYSANPVNWIISAGILLTTVYFLLKKDQRGWLIIAAEMILGGAGNFLEVYGVSLRTLLLVFSITIFFSQSVKNKTYNLFLGNKIALYIFIAFYAIIGSSAIRGFFDSHNLKLIFADTVPYLFFLYYFPLKQLAASESFVKISSNLLFSAIIGNFIFTYFTLAGFSSGIFVLQDSYYHWFRDVASGKITDYGTGFFRIILNEQLLLVPLFLLMLHNIIARRQQNAADTAISKNNWIASPKLIMTGTLLVILATNLTRIYFVALAIGIIFLFSKTNWKRWLAYSAGAFIFFILAFSLTHLAATKGKSFGWEYLGLRLQSIAAPQTEESSLSRMLLLPKILEKIKLHPLLGNGLGDTVTVYSPIFKQNITTPHFDWGYLEIFAEMGIVGLVVWILFVGYLILKTKQKRGLLASFLALLIINMTSPALFHVMGIAWVVYLLSHYDS
ncbi:MAG: O-antigen ligase family protein [Patescibacteria group bacterium]